MKNDTAGSPALSPAINLLIADDEYFIRQRMKKIIPWEELNLQFAGEAENGAQVLEMLEELSVDLLILDIKMPRMTGIEAAEKICAKYPAVHMVVLTGYNDFEYARSLLRFGVKDYLLKPVSPKDLRRTLETCIASIREARQHKHTNEMYLHYKKCTSLKQVRTGAMSVSRLCELYPEYLCARFLCFTGIYIYEDTDAVVHRLVRRLREAGYPCEYLRSGEYIYSLQTFFSDETQITGMRDILAGFIGREAAYLYIYSGNPFPMDGGWDENYKKSRFCLTQRYFHPSSCITTENSLIPPTAAAASAEESCSDDLPEIRHSLILSLSSRDEEQLTALVSRIFSSIGRKRSVNYLNLMITEIFIVYHVYYQVPENSAQHINDFISAVIDEEYLLSGLEATVLSYGMACIRKNDTSYANISLSRRLIEYIDKNYTQSDLSVALMADLFRINPSYMGSVFKKATGGSILQYIAEVRLKAAKELLSKGGLSVSEVASMVGYSDVYYFSKRFKKAFGCSPKDYSLRQVSLEKNE